MSCFARLDPILVWSFVAHVLKLIALNLMCILNQARSWMSYRAFVAQYLQAVMHDLSPSFVACN